MYIFSMNQQDWVRIKATDGAGELCGEEGHFAFGL